MRVCKNDEPRASEYMSTYEQDFEHAYTVLSDPLFRYSLFKVSDRDVALDLVHDSFAKAWDYLERGKHIEDYKSFLYKTLRNAIVDHYREKTSDSLDTLAESGFDPVDVSGPTHADRLDGEQVLGLIHTLPPDTRDVIFFRYVNDLSFAEIATLTGESVNTLTVRAHRGLEKLKKLTQHYGT